MTTDQLLDDQYLTWLYNLVPPREGQYWTLLRQLYTTEFIWFIPNDDNRAEDGKALRWEFIESENTAVDQTWLDLGCSFLEMLIGLARRLEFEAGGEYQDWFWHLINVLELSHCHDALRRFPRQHVQNTVERVICRTYHSDGHGGLFPQGAFDTNEDQREVEIWYQMSTWLLYNS